MSRVGRESIQFHQTKLDGPTNIMTSLTYDDLGIADEIILRRT